VCQIPTWILGLGSVNISCNIPNSKVIVHEGLKSKVLHGSLNDLCALVGFCTGKPQQGIKFQLDIWVGLYEYLLYYAQHLCYCPYIKEEQTTQWPIEKVQKDKRRSTKHTHKTKDRNLYIMFDFLSGDSSF
jgi:hypothetical protein